MEFTLIVICLAVWYFCDDARWLDASTKNQGTKIIDNELIIIFEYHHYSVWPEYH